MAKGTGLTEAEARALTKLVDRPRRCLWIDQTMERLCWLGCVRITAWPVWFTVTITDLGRAALAERGGAAVDPG